MRLKLVDIRDLRPVYRKGEFVNETFPRGFQHSYVFASRNFFGDPIFFIGLHGPSYIIISAIL
jgi:hypothetical protein